VYQANQEGISKAIEITMTTYSERFETLKAEAEITLANLINKYGVPSEHADYKCLPIKKIVYKCTNVDIGDLAEITNNEFITADGVYLDHCVLDLPDYYKLIDHLQKHYEEPEPEEPKDNKKYYCFGEQAAKTYFENNRVEDILDQGVEFCLYVHDPNSIHAVDNLLSAFEGYGGYVELAECEYAELSNYEEK